LFPLYYMSVTILLHYGPTRTRLSTRSQPVTSDVVQPFPAAKPTVVLLDFYGTLARAVSRGPLAAELFARRGLPFDQQVETLRTRLVRPR